MDPLILNSRHLRAMVAIVASGRIGTAARAVNLTQPAVTQGIAKLEAQIGLPLFDRRPDGMIPTDAARILAPRAQAALRLIGSRHATGAQIRAYLALADAGSYAAAADATGLREASLHRAVGDLSLSLGQMLVERRGRSVVLTAKGAAVARNFRLAVAELKSAMAELSALQGGEVGRIVIGAMPLSRARLLPQVIRKYNVLHPEIDLSIVEGSHAELASPLRDGEIDLLIGALRPQPLEGIAQQSLFVDRPIVIGPAGHPLAQADGVTATDLARYPWILPSIGTPLRAQWTSMFEGAGIKPPPVRIECGSVIMVRQMLANSDFLTLLSADQVRIELRAGWLVAIGDAPGDLSRTIGISTREDWRPTALQAQFIETVVDEVAQIGYPRT